MVNKTEVVNKTVKADATKPAALKPIAPVVPAGPLPSEVYENIELDKYYHGRLEANKTGKAEKEPMSRFPVYSPLWKGDNLWHYYSFDVAKQLGKDLEVKDEKAILSQLNTDLKYA